MVSHASSFFPWGFVLWEGQGFLQEAIVLGR